MHGGGSSLRTCLNQCPCQCISDHQGGQPLGHPVAYLRARLPAGGKLGVCVQSRGATPVCCTRRRSQWPRDVSTSIIIISGPSSIITCFICKSQASCIITCLRRVVAAQLPTSSTKAHAPLCHSSHRYSRRPRCPAPPVIVSFSSHLNACHHAAQGRVRYSPRRLLVRARTLVDCGYACPLTCGTIMGLCCACLCWCGCVGCVRWDRASTAMSTTCPWRSWTRCFSHSPPLLRMIPPRPPATVRCHVQSIRASSQACRLPFSPCRPCMCLLVTLAT